MATPFLGSVMAVSFNFAPKGWAMCNGQLLPINQNQALFALLGTTFGGDGRVNFALPDLRGRAAMHTGNGHTLGERGGEENHTVTIPELPTHQHTLLAAVTAGTSSSPSGSALASAPMYKPDPQAASSLGGNAVSNVGGSQPHLNQQPYLAINWIIALQGIFPSQN